MKKFIIALILIVLPNAALAQTSVTNFPVGTCKQIEGKTGFYQQLSDGTWAQPTDRLNTCMMNGFNDQFEFGGGYNNPLGQMTTAEWYRRCMLMNTLLPLPECQGFNPLFSGNGSNTGFWNYPGLGRDYLTFSVGNFGLSVDLSGSSSSSSSNSGGKWRNILLGIGLGWMLNRATS